MTATLTHPAPSMFARLWQDAPLLTGLTLLMALAAIPLVLAMALDARQFQGSSVWLKPLKFHAALVIYTATLAVYARWLPEGLAGQALWRAYLGLVAVAILAELVWIGGAAALATASHFNVSSPFWGAVYGLMGAAAVTLTSLSLAFGLAIARNPATGLPPALQAALALGLILTFVLTVVTAGTMSSTSGHHVGTPVSGLRVPLMGWSREVGDLRVAHFFATHALHAIPLAGLVAIALLSARMAMVAVIVASLGYAAFVLATFAQGLAGRPFI
ncbi:MAG: hypothetical protein ACT4OK_16540 [Gemmobacter sp.]